MAIDYDTAILDYFNDTFAKINEYYEYTSLLLRVRNYIILQNFKMITIPLNTAKHYPQFFVRYQLCQL